MTSLRVLHIHELDSRRVVSHRAIEQSCQDVALRLLRDHRKLARSSVRAALLLQPGRVSKSSLGLLYLYQQKTTRRSIKLLVRAALFLWLSAISTARRSIQLLVRAAIFLQLSAVSLLVYSERQTTVMFVRCTNCVVH